MFFASFLSRLSKKMTALLLRLPVSALRSKAYAKGETAQDVPFFLCKPLCLFIPFIKYRVAKNNRFKISIYFCYTVLIYFLNLSA